MDFSSDHGCHSELISHYAWQLRSETDDDLKGNIGIYNASPWYRMHEVELLSQLALISLTNLKPSYNWQLFSPTYNAWPQFLKLTVHPLKLWNYSWATNIGISVRTLILECKATMLQYLIFINISLFKIYTMVLQVWTLSAWPVQCFSLMSTMTWRCRNQIFEIQYTLPW